MLDYLRIDLKVGDEIVITSNGYKDLTLKVTGTGKHWNC